MVRIVSIRTLGLIGAVVLALTMPACERMKNYTELERIQRAKDFEAKGEWRKAAIELKNALQLNAKSAEARLLLGQLYIDQGSGFGFGAEVELKRAIELGVPRDTVRVGLATAMIMQGNFKAALEEAKIGPTVSDTARARLLVVQARAMQGLGRLAEGCKQAAEAQKMDKDYLPAYWMTAYCAASAGRNDDARAQLDAAIKLAPASGATWTELGNLERVAGRNKESEQAYTTALKYIPESMDALLGRATTRIHANKLDEALKDVQVVLRMISGHPVARHLNGVLEYKKGRFTEAAAEFERALKTGVDLPAALLWSGMAELALRNFEQAASRLRAYLQVAPGHPEAHILLAYVNANMGNRDDAHERLRLLRSVKIENADILTVAGNAHLILGEATDASEYYTRATAAKPDDVSIKVNFARARMRENDIDGAIKLLNEAIKLSPQEPEAHHLLVQAQIDAKRVDAALQSAAAWAVAQPKNAQARVQKARVHLAMNDDVAARAELLKAFDMPDGRREAGLLLALLSEKKREWAAARGWYDKVLQAAKDDVAAMIAQYGMELRAGQPDQAIKILERAAATRPEQASSAMLLGEVLLKSGRYRQVLDATRAALDKDKDNRGLLELHGAAYMAMHEPRNALVVYRQIEKLEPKSADALYYVASAQAAQGADAEYRATLGRALKIEPRHFRSRLAKIRIDMADRRLDDALKQAQMLRKDHPAAVDAAQVESEVLMAKGDPAGAIGVLSAFHLANPRSWDGASLLVKTYLFTRQTAKAVEVARSLLNSFPDEPLAYGLLAHAQNGAGDREGALRTHMEFAARNTGSAPAQFAIGNSYVFLGKETEAIKHFRAALKLQPDHLESQQGLATLESRAGRYAEALRVADEIKRQRPGSAAGNLLEGDIQMAKRDFAAASQSFGRALAAENIPDAAIRLHRAMVAAKTPLEADTKLLAWLRDRPEEQGVREYYAESLISRGKVRDAINQYEILLKHTSANWLAINNLANLYLMVGDSKALATAERALTLQPQSAVVKDTLGWVAFKRGDTARATKVLADAAKALPDNPSIQYHYAAALAKGGDKKSAKSLLDKVLSGGQRFSEEAEARSLRDSL
jgi:cellulose synthase operon protein C